MAVLFVRKGASSQYRFKQLADIKNSDFTLGRVRGDSFGEDHKKLLEDPDFSRHVISVKTAQQLPLMLVLKRIDGYLIDVSPGWARAKEINQHENIEAYPHIVFEDTLHFFLARKALTLNSLTRSIESWILLSERPVFNNSLIRHQRFLSVDGPFISKQNIELMGTNSCSIEYCQ